MTELQTNQIFIKVARYTPKRVTRGGTHFRGLAKKRRSGGDIVYDFTGRGIELQTSRTRNYMSIKIIN